MRTTVVAHWKHWIAATSALSALSAGCLHIHGSESPDVAADVVIGADVLPDQGAPDAALDVAIDDVATDIGAPDTATPDVPTDAGAPDVWTDAGGGDAAYAMGTLPGYLTCDALNAGQASLPPLTIPGRYMGTAPMPDSPWDGSPMTGCSTAMPYEYLGFSLDREAQVTVSFNPRTSRTCTTANAGLHNGCGLTSPLAGCAATGIATARLPAGTHSVEIPAGSMNCFRITGSSVSVIAEPVPALQHDSCASPAVLHPGESVSERVVGGPASATYGDRRRRYIRIDHGDVSPLNVTFSRGTGGELFMQGAAWVATSCGVTPGASPYQVDTALAINSTPITVPGSPAGSAWITIDVTEGSTYTLSVAP